MGGQARGGRSCLTGREAAPSGWPTYHPLPAHGSRRPRHSAVCRQRDLAAAAATLVPAKPKLPTPDALSKCAAQGGPPWHNSSQHLMSPEPPPAPPAPAAASRSPTCAPPPAAPTSARSGWPPAGSQGRTHASQSSPTAFEVEGVLRPPGRPADTARAATTAQPAEPAQRCRSQRPAHQPGWAAQLPKLPPTPAVQAPC